MKNYIGKQRDTIDSQRCYNVMKTHRIKLGVEMNNKYDLIMQKIIFFICPNTSFSTHIFICT